MILLHDDDLVQLKGVYKSTVGRSFRQSTHHCVDIFSAVSLLSDTERYQIRCNVKPHPKPRANSPQLSDWWALSVSQFLITHCGGTHPKDLSSARNSASASADTESAWVATLSNIFEKQCRLHFFRVCILITLRLIALSSTLSSPQSLHSGTPLLQEERFWLCSLRQTRYDLFSIFSFICLFFYFYLYFDFYIIACLFPITPLRKPAVGDDDEQHQQYLKELDAIRQE